MAETAAKTTTTPRKRATTPRAAAAKPAASKATPAKAAAKPATATSDEEVTRIQITLGEPFEETKSYAKFNLKFDADGNDTGMVGTLYAPLGVVTVKLLLVGDEIDVVTE